MSQQHNSNKDDSAAKADGKGSGLGGNPTGDALSMVERGLFPDDWALVPVRGKATYIQGWASKPLSREEAIERYRTDEVYRGFGVVTGEFSGGLIALDIDGPLADERYRAFSGENYRVPGEEGTMSWTSGKPGRRQILWRVPAGMLPQLREVRKVILRMDGGWRLGSGDAKRVTPTDISDDPTYEEVVLRFNQCQSVLPGSPHPDTKQPYRFLSYNNGEVADAPEFILDVLRPFQKPVQWLGSDDLRSLKNEFTETALPTAQIRGWFFRPEVQERLMPRLQDLIFKHPVFDKYGWALREGHKPQMMSGCPWHKSVSGTSFQFSTETGCWDCKACAVGGDVLDFVHKIATGDKHAPRPVGADLEKYVAELSQKLGYVYPDDAKAVQRTVEMPRVQMSSREFHEALIKIKREFPNPALMLAEMADLAQATGRRLTGAQCLAAVDEYSYYEKSEVQNNQNPMLNVEKMTFLIPGLLMRPTQVLLHAAAGVGKTSACMGLARAVGKGETFIVRGIEQKIEPGPVLWIQNDQSMAKLRRDCEDNGIDPENSPWFIVKRAFQVNHTHRLIQWMHEYKPRLVVIDSIGSCSTRTQIEEREKAFAHPMYEINDLNGDLENGFPATTIIWIHHDNADGEARGTRYLPAAVDEQWALRKLKEDEREGLRQQGLLVDNCRFIQVKKSRLGREGDRLIVERDADFAYTVRDFTPTERRSGDDGQGSPTPNTMALRIVRDACEGLGAASGGITASTVHELLEEELAGQGRAVEIPVRRSVRRWLDRWVEDGVLALGGKVTVEGSAKPVNCYSTPSHARMRVRGATSGCHLSLATSDPLVRQGSASDSENPCHLLQTQPPSTEGDAQEQVTRDSAADSVSLANPSDSNGSDGASDKNHPEVSLRARARARSEAHHPEDDDGEFDDGFTGDPWSDTAPPEDG